MIWWGGKEGVQNFRVVWKQVPKGGGIHPVAVCWSPGLRDPYLQDSFNIKDTECYTGLQGPCHTYQSTEFVVFETSLADNALEPMPNNFQYFQMLTFPPGLFQYRRHWMLQRVAKYLMPKHWIWCFWNWSGVQCFLAYAKQPFCLFKFAILIFLTKYCNLLQLLQNNLKNHKT